MRCAAVFVGLFALGSLAVVSGSGLAHGQAPAPVRVQSQLSLKLTLSVPLPASGKTKFENVRIGTKELIESLREQQGLTGSKGKLVVRRDISDTAFAAAKTLLVIDDQTEFDFTADVSNIPVEASLAGLPAVFAAAPQAEQFGKNGDPTVLARERRQLVTLRFGDVDSNTDEILLFGLQTSNAKLKRESNVDVGYLFAKRKTEVIGSARVDLTSEALGIVDGVVKGEISLGGEKILKP